MASALFFLDLKGKVSDLLFPIGFGYDGIGLIRTWTANLSGLLDPSGPQLPWRHSHVSRREIPYAVE